MSREVINGGGSGTPLPPIQASGASVVVPDAHLLFTAEFSRIGDDLLLTGQDGTVLLIQDYFALDVPPMLLSPLGAMLPADLVAALVGPRAPGQYAQAGAPEGAEPIGQVESLSGTAQATRADGTVIQLSVGDPVFQNDVVRTGPNSKLIIAFEDETVFSLSANARMVLDKFVYEPDGASNLMIFSLVQGAFTFVSGQVAPTGSMLIQTPVATIGIRGTTVHITVDVDTGAIRVSQSPGPDGSLSIIEFLDPVTQEILAQFSDADTNYDIVTLGAVPVASPKPLQQIEEEEDSGGEVQNIQSTVQGDQPEPEPGEEQQGELEGEQTIDEPAEAEGTPEGEGEATEEAAAEEATEEAAVEEAPLETAAGPEAGGTLTSGGIGSVDEEQFGIDDLDLLGTPDPFVDPSEPDDVSAGGDAGADPIIVESEPEPSPPPPIAVEEIAPTPSNSAPTVALANTTASLAENTNTASAVKVADIVVTDDALGTNVLSLAGADAGLFEIVGLELFLRAGAVLDFETNPSLDVTVQVDDAGVGGFPDDTEALSINVTVVDETIVGTAFGELITTGAGNDTIDGRGGDDVIFAGGGNDTILYALGDGSDTIDGGTGSDTLSATGSAVSDTFSIIGSSGDSNLAFTAGGVTSLVTNVENIVVDTGDGDDTVVISGDLSASGVSQNTVTIIGGAGNDLLDAGGVTSGTQVVLSGLGGDDTLIGGAGDDTLDGGADNDTLISGGGAFGFVDTTATGTDLALSDDDTQSVDLSFTFSFQGVDYTSITVSSNGFIWMGGDSGDDCCDADLTEFLNDAPRISPAWFDLDPGSGGSVTVTDNGDSVIITWQDVPEFSNTDGNVFQVQLFADGTIVFAYETLNADLSGGHDHDAIVGITEGGGVTDPGETDLSVIGTFDTGSEGTVYEFIERDNTDGADNFDLSGKTIVFLPNGSGGWTVTSGTGTGGGGGNDTLIGGTGNDTFVFAPGFGDDVISDFTAGAASDDVIDLSAFTIGDFATLLGNIADVGGNAVITVDSGTITLTGVTKAALHPDDFLGLDVNEAPVVATSAAAVGEGASVTITGAILSATDAETGDPALLSYTVTGTTNGVVQLSGATVTNFTQQDVDDSLVTFLHDGGETAAAGFTITVDDPDGGTSLPATVDLTVTGVNDAPTLINNSLTVAEGATVVLSSSDLSATDPDDADAGLIFTVSGVANGQFEFTTNPGVAIAQFTQQNITDGVVVFVHDGGEAAPSYSVSVSDGLLSDAGAAAITFNSLNDAPTLINNSLTVAEGATVVLRASDLSATDPDDADAGLIFTVSGVVNGQFEFTTNPGVAITQFTQAQVSAGDVRFVHDGGEAAAAYQVTVSDGVNTTAPAAASVTFTNLNDPPIVDLNGSGRGIDFAAPST
ncbi:MAG: FecR domain-containing protein, partial [Proteobacteria bacterium]|nr:FecR domain-containing protein [Pseudomonadota bacterium]